MVFSIVKYSHHYKLVLNHGNIVQIEMSTSYNQGLYFDLYVSVTGNPWARVFSNSKIEMRYSQHRLFNPGKVSNGNFSWRLFSPLRKINLIVFRVSKDWFISLLLR